MGRLVLYMSMSLDGFIAGPDDRAGQELGRDGGRLFDWLDDRMSDGPSGQVFRELMATGAVISGRRTFELAGRWQGDHHDGVPIFVLTTSRYPEQPFLFGSYRSARLSKER
jgi:dihydrofolate reductase